MIALTVSAAAYEALPADWDFSTIGNTEGWTANDSVQEMLVQDGDLCIHILQILLQSRHRILT